MMRDYILGNLDFDITYPISTIKSGKSEKVRFKRILRVKEKIFGLVKYMKYISMEIL